MVREAGPKREGVSMAEARERRRSRGLVLTLAVGGLLVILLLVVVVTNLGKWTCGPPDGVWVESVNRCLSVP
jgi:uncharacterized integral membrane protein